MYCKYCGKQIDSDAVYCPQCGKRLSEAKSNDKGSQTKSSTYYSIENEVKETKSDCEVINIPSGHRMCPNCDKILPLSEFNLSKDKEFNLCNSCEHKDSLSWKISLSIPIIIWLFVILYIVSEMIGKPYFAYDKLAYTVLGVTFIGAIPLIIIFLLSKWLLDFTHLGSSLTKKKIERLRKLKDQNGRTVFSPISRSMDEDWYHLKTGHYASRDILPGHFRCPCCDKQFPLSKAKSFEGQDNETRQIGRKIQTKTTTYNYNVCEDCYNYKKHEATITLIAIVVCIIGVPLIAFYYNGFSWGWLIGGFFLGLFGATTLSYILIIPIYRMIIKLSTGRNLFVSFGDAAHNKALNPLK